MSRRRFDVIMTLSLRPVSTGLVSDTALCDTFTSSQEFYVLNYVQMFLTDPKVLYKSYYNCAHFTFVFRVQLHSCHGVLSMICVCFSYNRYFTIDDSEKMSSHRIRRAFLSPNTRRHIYYTVAIIAFTIWWQIPGNHNDSGRQIVTRDDFQESVTVKWPLWW